MAGSGPPPNPNSRRQSGQQAHTWTDLPATGYIGPVPPWPFAVVSDDEAAMWERYWRKPQAAAWAQLGIVDEVAAYVRSFLLGASGDMKALSEARQWTIPLGLTPGALLRNRWRVRDVEVGPTAATKSKKPRALKVVDDALARP